MHAHADQPNHPSRSPGSWTPQQALAEQARLARQITRDRQRISSAEVPLGLFGVLSLIAALIASTGQWTALGIFWSIAGPAGGGFLAWWFRRQDLRLRFDQPPTAAMVVTAISLVAGALVLGWSGEGESVFFAVGCGYVLFAAATANATTFRVAVAIIAATWLAQADRWLALTGASEPARSAALTATVGIVQLIGAVTERQRTRRADA
ncbi:MAG: hypothetical protein QM679_11860 [Patulibacter sp.]